MSMQSLAYQSRQYPELWTQALEDYQPMHRSQALAPARYGLCGLVVALGAAAAGAGPLWCISLAIVSTMALGSRWHTWSVIRASAQAQGRRINLHPEMRTVHAHMLQEALSSGLDTRRLQTEVAHARLDLEDEPRTLEP